MKHRSLFGLLTAIAALLSATTFIHVAQAGVVWVAYHDLGGATDVNHPNFAGNPSNVVTAQGTDPAAIIRLRNFADGADTGVDFSVTDSVGTSDDTATANRYPWPNTAAAALFGTADSFFVEHGGTTRARYNPLHFTFTGLDPNLQYDVALYGDRSASPDGAEVFTLIGADAAINSSSSGTVIDNWTTRFDTRPNAETGYIARWTGVDPSADGTFQIEVDPTIAHPTTNIAYFTALRLAAAPATAPPLATILATDFTGRTVSDLTASNIPWETNGVADPGDLTASDGFFLFDTSAAADKFAVRQNIGNEGPWAVDIPLAVGDYPIDLDHLNMEAYIFNNNGGLQSTSRHLDITVSLLDGSNNELWSDSVLDVYPEGGGVVQPRSLVVDLSGTERLLANTDYYLQITASSSIYPAGGNNAGIGSLALRGYVVPEPGTWLLLLTAVALGLLMRRRA